MNLTDIINVVKYLFNTKSDKELVGGDVTPSIKPTPASASLVITWIESPNFNYRGNSPIKAIILHHTDGSLQSTLSWFQSPVSKVSAHYVIGRDGSIYQMVSDSNRAWHAGVSTLNGLSDVNTFSIGIELEGDGVTPFTDVQYNANLNLCKSLKQKYSITNEWIDCHKNIALPLGRKVDPAPFDLAKFRIDLA